MSISLLPQADTWRAFRFTLPGRRVAADAYLTRGIGPLLEGLRQAGQVRDWSFIRDSATAMSLFVQGASPRLLVAQLTGIAAAIGVPGPVPCPPPDPPRHHDPRMVGVALGLITMTPRRRARLGAAVDLAMVAAVRNCPAVDTSGWNLAAPPAPCPAPPSRAALDPRWHRVTSALCTDAHPLAVWSRVLDAHRRSPGYDGAEAFGMVHLLHNQLGLTAADEQRVHATLVRSLSAHRARPVPAGPWHGLVVSRPPCSSID
jgi:hypothetical protein